MAFPNIDRMLLIKKAKDLGFPEGHYILESAKKGDTSALRGLMQWVSSRDKNFKSSPRGPINALNENLNPEKDYFSGYRSDRAKARGKDGYGFERYPYGDPEEGDSLLGKPAYYENVPLYTKDQSNYLQSLLDFSADKMPQLYNELDTISNRGILGELFGDRAEKGVRGMFGGLEGYAPEMIGTGLGTALTGGGIGDILQSLIGSVASQYTRNRALPMMQSNNPGMSSLSNLYNNRM